MRLGERVGAYWVIDQAPLEFIQGSRTRAINGRLVTGSWSDPWWAYAPGLGWALLKRWRSKAVPGGKYAGPPIPALDEVVIEPWQAQQ